MHFSHTHQFYTLNGEARLRVRTVTATDVILPGHGTPRDSTVQPLALHSSTGQAPRRPLHTERGHLVGLRFGGPESPYNLVPMYAGFNSGAGGWGKFETKLEKHLNTPGTAVNLAVEVSYPDKTTPIPNGFRITVTHNRGAALRERFAAPIELLHTAPIVFYMEPHEFMDQAGALLQERQSQMEEFNWYVETDGVSVGALKALQVGGLDPTAIDFTNARQKNAFYAARPYAVLDFLYYRFPEEYKQLGGPHLMSGINNVDKFTDGQVKFILEMNAVKYRGYLSSDLVDVTPHEEIQYLMPASTDYQAQVDHASPRGKAGANAYSNARVISARLNKALNSSVISDAVQQSLNDLAGI
jgi:hypothetical protein